MRYITLGEILSLHGRILSQSGGSPGIRDFGGVASAVAQPRVSIDGDDAYPSLIEKAAALDFSLSQNHGFIDGNKRIADGTLTRESLVTWLEKHVTATTT